MPALPLEPEEATFAELSDDGRFFTIFDPDAGPAVMIDLLTGDVDLKVDAYGAAQHMFRVLQVMIFNAGGSQTDWLRKRIFELEQALRALKKEHAALKRRSHAA